jgi:hypothetical protein
VLGRRVSRLRDVERKVGALHQPVHVEAAVHLGHDGIAGEVDDHLVERFVRPQVRELVDQLAVSDTLDRGRERAAKCRDRVGSDPADGLLDGVELEGRPRVVSLGHQAGRKRPDAVPAAASGGHEPLADEPRERLVDRTPRDPELVGERLKPELLARTEVAGEQSLANPLVRLLVQIGPDEPR